MEDVINLNNIFYKSYSIDPNSGHSIYVFDSTYLPSSEELGAVDKYDYDIMITELMDLLVKKLPQSPFSLVVFSSGFSAKKISWVYGVKMFSKLPKKLKSYLQKTYIVHESFFVRTVYQVLSNAMSFKFLGGNSKPDMFDPENGAKSASGSIVHVADLTDLSCLIDITRLRISLNVYLHDSELTGEYFLEVPDYYYERLTPNSKRQYRQIIFDKIFNRLKYDAITNELVFQRPGSYKRVNILLSIMERNNYIDLSQWDIYSLASIFTNFLKNKSKPLIPIDLISLPLVDDFEYTFQIFKDIIRYNDYYDILRAIFPLFISILNTSEVTRHDPRSLSKALTPTLCKEKVSMMSSDRLAIGTKYIRNLFEYFPRIVNTLENNSKDQDNISIDDLTIQLDTKANINSRTSSGASDLLLSDTGKPISTPKLSLKIPKLPPKLPPRRNTSGEVEVKIDSPQKKFRPDLSSPAPSVSEDEGNTSMPSVASNFSKVSTSTRTSSVSSDNDQINSNVEQIKKIQPSQDFQNMITDSSNDVDISNVVLKKNKIQQFDKELQKKKRQAGEEITVKATKFSTESYSDIKTNKVSKLAALYEERLMGLKVMEEIRRENANLAI
ncbi:Ecm25p [Nakaseomyces bracarensis]|uniref:Ecm25p n=1 Tax=Nakaseomyces bracarensis TaxID=273131 RepID=UPI003871BA7A